MELKRDCDEGQTLLHVAPGEKTIASQIKDNKALLEFDWVGLGSPRTFRLKIGDKIEDINLPDDFPKVGLDHTDIIKVYDEEQKVSIKTTSTRAPDNIEIEIDLDPIQFPTYVSAGDQVLFCVSRVGNRTTVRNRDGKWLWDIVVVELNDFQKGVGRGDPCRPECIWTSFKSAERQHPWEQESIRLEPNQGLRPKTGQSSNKEVRLIGMV